MPRDPKPWFRKDRDAWFVTIMAVATISVPSATPLSTASTT